VAFFNLGNEAAPAKKGKFEMKVASDRRAPNSPLRTAGKPSAGLSPRATGTNGNFRPY
jgi:hypothetical protein